MSDSLSIAAIVLAAGQSRRMGSVNKLLMEVEGLPMVGRVVNAIRDSGVDRLWVVTGYERDRVEGCLCSAGVAFVFNEAYESGMGASLAAGARALREERFDGVLVCLGDLPYLKAESVDRVVAAFRKKGGESIAIPCYKGRRGHPVLFPSNCLSDLEKMESDAGAKELIQSNRYPVLELDVSDQGIIRDVDTL